MIPRPKTMAEIVDAAARFEAIFGALTEAIESSTASMRELSRQLATSNEQARVERVVRTLHR